MIVSRRFTHIAAALRHPVYAIYVAGSSVSLVGFWVQRVAVGWLTWELTESGTWLGIVAFLDLFPAVVVGPLAGAASDRADRLRIMFVSQALAMVQALALFALSAGDLVTIQSLAVLVLFNGLVMGFNQPSRLAMVANLVPRDDLPTAIAVNSIAFNLARFVGPAIAGPILLAGGVTLAFAINALSYLVFLIALERIRRRLPASALHPAVTGGRSILGDVRAGVGYAAGHPGIGPILLLVTAMAFGLRPYMELLPGFAAEVFGRGPGTLAALTSAIGIGAVIGGLWMAQRPAGAPLAGVVLVSSLLSVLCMLLFLTQEVFWVAMLAVALVSVFLAVSAIAAQTTIQIAVDSAMRGRVLGLYGIIFRAGPAVGAVIMGVASELYGLRWPVAVGAVLSAAAWLWVWRRREPLYRALAGGAG